MTLPEPKSRRILVVDDDSENRSLIVETLVGERYEVDSAESGQEAIQKIEDFKPELVMLDYNMPGLSGLETLNLLRKKEIYTAVIFVSANSDQKLVVNCLGAGADDYIRKPFNVGELLARIRVRFRNKDVYDELEVANRKLRELAERDDVTGLYNMRFIYQKIEAELKRAKRYSNRVGVIMMDLDHFKSVNDEFDHLFGSFVLKEIGKLITRNMREVDFAARYGGDEFLMVLPSTDPSGIREFTERIRSVIEKHVCTDGRNRFSRTASLGFALTEPTEEITAKELVRRADHALYEAKETGRNRVVGWTLGQAPVPNAPARARAR